MIISNVLGVEIRFTITKSKIVTQKDEVCFKIVLRLKNPFLSLLFLSSYCVTLLDILVHELSSSWYMLQSSHARGGQRIISYYTRKPQQFTRLRTILIFMNTVNFHVKSLHFYGKTHNFHRFYINVHGMYLKSRVNVYF